MLLPAGITFDPLTQSANLTFMTVSFVGTVTSNTHFHPLLKVPSADAKVWTAEIWVTPRTDVSA